MKRKKNTRRNPSMRRSKIAQYLSTHMYHTWNMTNYNWYVDNDIMNLSDIVVTSSHHIVEYRQHHFMNGWVWHLIHFLLHLTFSRCPTKHWIAPMLLSRREKKIKKIFFNISIVSMYREKAIKRHNICLIMWS